jgi:hypothetical protein
MKLSMREIIKKIFQYSHNNTTIHGCQTFFSHKVFHCSFFLWAFFICEHRMTSISNSANTMINKEIRSNKKNFRHISKPTKHFCKIQEKLAKYRFAYWPVNLYNNGRLALLPREC